MSIRLTHLVMITLACCSLACVIADAQERDRIANYLDRHDMIDLLEIHLQSQIDHARSDEQREDAINALAAFYLDQIRSLPKDSRLREQLIPRGWAFTMDYEGMPLVELRLELLINRYLPIEQIVELHQLLLDDPDERARSTAQLAEIEQRLQRLESALQVDAAKLERMLRSVQAADAADSRADELSEVRRSLSLTRYYIGWCGYSRAVLLDRRVPDDAIKSFGWLLGSKGQVPTVDDLERAILEYEHVARAAIGAALCKAHNEEFMTARVWIKQIIADETVPAQIVENARIRRLQIEAMDAQWGETHRLIELLHNTRNDPLSVAEARFIAIAVLDDQRSKSIKDPDAERVAQLVLEDLIKHGEIGHILDLQRRFGSLPLIADRFISQYASALMELDQAEQAPQGGRFTTAANLFAKALKSDDADQYPAERDDSILKLAYCAIKGDRAAEAIQACARLIEADPDEEILEQARWLQIVAMEMLAASDESASTEQLAELVTQYILAYPDSSNAARLLLRHGLGGTIEPSTAASVLLQIPEDDPAAIPARRMLIQLNHQIFRATGRSNPVLVDEVLELVDWLWTHTADQPTDLADANARLTVVRIVLDMTSSSNSMHTPVITRAILRGLLLTEFHTSLESTRDEILLRRVEFLLATDNLDRAEAQLQQMHEHSSLYAIAAKRRVFVAALDEWESDQDNLLAADRVISLGNELIEQELPPPPEKLTGDLAAIINAVSWAADHRATLTNDSTMSDLAYRLGKLIIERGMPDETVLRRTARIAEQSNDPETALNAWLLLLGSYLSSEPAWYEARYESFRLMLVIDRDRASAAVNQYRVLHPSTPPEPWGSKIQSILNTIAPEDDG